MSFFQRIAEIARHRLINSFIWNFSGQILPLLAALICIPVLVNRLGDERFGFLAIAWVIIGYFSLFDLGLGRAITYIVAKRIAENQCIEKLVNTALKFLLIVGTAVLIVFMLTSGLIVEYVLNVSVSLKKEASIALTVLSAGLPFVILSIGLRGVLEAFQLFKKISFVTIPSGILLFVMPVIVSFFSTSLVHIFSSLVFIRFLQFILFLITARGIMRVKFFDAILKNELRALLSFGGWMTVTNIISPIMVNMDRFFIGSKVAVSAVTNYVVPFDLITKALVLPSAVSGVLFPEFSRLHSNRERHTALFLLAKSSIFLSLAFFVPLAIVYLFSFELLSIWISEDFAISSSDILKVLCIGVYFNGIAYLPFSFIQGAGRSDLTAKLHVAELFFYLPTLIFMIEKYGVEGAAYAWVFRVTFDFLILFFISVFMRGRN
jgi:O-antigen/teichoic acid export membrane protein